MRQPVFDAAPKSETPAFVMATLAGIVAACAGAVVWVLISISTGYQLGLIAIGAAWLVGMAIRCCKASNRPAYGYIGAALSLLAIVAGDAGAIVARYASHDRVDFLTELRTLAPGEIVHGMLAAGDIMTVIFYLIALVTGYRVAMGANARQPHVPPAA